MKVLTTAILSLILTGAVFSAPEVRTDTVTVKGVATTNVTPDTVFITLFVIDQGMVAEQAVAKVDEKAKAIKAALLKAHPEISAITVSDVKLGEKSSRVFRAEEANEPPRPEAVRRLLITLNFGAGDLGKIVDTALLGGAALQIPSPSYSGDLGSVIQYGLVSVGKVEAELTASALADAQRRAGVLAKAGGKSLGQLLSVSEDAVMNYAVYPRGSQARLPTKHVAGSPDDVEMSRAVQVTYQWK
ncbi:MAG: SIMPL domain-containing protein [Verrucomicrobiia bacterium]